MDDLELTKACAEAMSIPWPQMQYDPLTNDAQCFALVKRFRLGLLCDDRDNMWIAEEFPNYEGAKCAADLDLNRAIVECVAALKPTA